MILSPSILAADFSCLKEEINLVESAGCEYLHIDVMDGHFVPNISFGTPIIKSIRGKSNLIFDVHLMLSEPSLYIRDFVEAGSDIITIHEESDGNTKKDLERIIILGKKAGLSIKPNTPVEKIYPYMEYLDQILIMSVEPGFGGQRFMPHTLEKVRILKRYIKENNLNIKIEMDGGINKNNLQAVLCSGVDVVVAGSSIFEKDKTVNNVKDFIALSEGV